MKKNKTSNYYAVACGFKTGIFTSWYGINGAEYAVNGFTGALYKGFKTKKEAERWLEYTRKVYMTTPDSGLV